MQKVKTQRPFDYQEINVMEPGHEKWKGLYEFDTPVVSLRLPIYTFASEYLSVKQIHVDKASTSDTTPSSLKLMHRFEAVDQSWR